MTKVIEVYPDSIDTSKRCLGVGDWYEYKFRVLITDELRARAGEIEFLVAMHMKIIGLNKHDFGEDLTEKYGNLVRLEGYTREVKLVNVDVIEWI